MVHIYKIAMADKEGARLKKLPDFEDAPGGTRLFAVFTFGNRRGCVKGNVVAFVVVDAAGSSIFNSFFKNGELIPTVVGTVMLAVDVVLPFSSFFAAYVAAVSRSIPPPI